MKVEWSFKDDYGSVGSVDVRITYYKKGDPSDIRIKKVTVNTTDGFVIIHKLEPDAEYTFQVSILNIMYSVYN